MLEAEFQQGNPRGRAMKIGEELRKLRRYRGLTLSQVSEQTDLSVSFLSDVERGKTNPSLDTLQKLSEFYGVAVNDIMKGAESDVVSQKVYPPGFEDFLKGMAGQMDPDTEELLLSIEHRSKRHMETKEDWLQLYYTVKSLLGR